MKEWAEFGAEPWPLPASWKWATMGDITEVVGGGTPSTTESQNFGGPVPWITPADMSTHVGKFIRSGSRSLSERGLMGSGARWLPQGTVLFSSRAPIGYVAIAATNLATNQGFKSFPPSEGVAPDYLFHWLGSAKRFADALASGTTFLEISGAKAALIPCPIAPLREQHRIVEKLEELLCDLDAGVAELRAAQAKLKLYRQSLLKAAVTGDLTVEWRERMAAGEASNLHGPDGDELPAGWTQVRVGDLARVGTGVTPLRSRADYFEGGTFPWVTSGALNVDVVLGASELLTPVALSECRLQIFPPGTLLVAMYVEGKTRGKCSELGFASTINQAIAAIVLHPESVGNKRFLKIFLLYSYAKMREQASGGVQPNLNLQIIKNIEVPLPPPDEQRVVVEVLDGLLENIAEQTTAITHALRQSEAQRKNILQAAFSGQLVPQDPNDEPASVLLERIRASREGKDLKIARRPRTVRAAV